MANDIKLFFCKLSGKWFLLLKIKAISYFLVVIKLCFFRRAPHQHPTHPSNTLTIPIISQVVFFEILEIRNAIIAETSHSSRACICMCIAIKRHTIWTLQRKSAIYSFDVRSMHKKVAHPHCLTPFLLGWASRFRCTGEVTNVNVGTLMCPASLILGPFTSKKWPEESTSGGGIDF